MSADFNQHNDTFRIDKLFKAVTSATSSIFNTDMNYVGIGMKLD